MSMVVKRGLRNSILLTHQIIGYGIGHSSQEFYVVLK